MKGLLLALLLCSTGGYELPQPSAPPAEAPRSYAHLNLISDGVAMGFGALYLAGATRRGAGAELGTVGLVGFPIMALLSPPLIHLLHKQGGRGAWSFLLRLVATGIASVTGVFVGAAASANEDGSRVGGAAVGGGVGAMIGLGIASVVDATVIANF